MTADELNRRSFGSPSRSLQAAVLLLAEYLVLSWKFDAAPLQARLPWLSGLGYVGPLLLVVGTATLLFARRELQALVAPVSGQRGGAAWLWAHGGSAVLFFAITAKAFGRSSRTAAHPHLWFGLWLAALAAVVLTLMPFLFSWHSLRSSVRRARAPLGAAAVAGLAAWVAGRYAEELWPLLGPSTVRAVTSLLRLFASHVVSRSDTLEVGTARFYVRVAPVCSGCEGIGLILVVTVIYLIYFRRQLRFPAALLLLPAGVLAAWAANVLRITALVWIGTVWSRKIAYGGFHSKSGWILFCAVALGLAAAARRLLSKPEAQQEQENAAAPYLAPFLTMTGVELIAGAFKQGSDIPGVYGALAALAVLVAFRRELRRMVEPGAPWTIGLGFISGSMLVLAPRVFPRTDLGPVPHPSPASPGLAVVWVLAALVVTPVVEELAFRAFLVPRLVSADFFAVPLRRWRWAPAALSAAAFGAVHHNWGAWTAAGLIYAWAQSRRGRVADAVLAHVTANACVFAWALRTTDWSLLT